MGVAAAIFLIVVLFVFREIQHNRELYRMSRLVSAAEAQRRQSQELLRLELVREARIVAEFQTQRYSNSFSPPLLADFALSVQRR
jgi:hypothetical protein